LQQKLKHLKVYCQNMACGVLELCLIATKFEGFKSVLPKYGKTESSATASMAKILLWCTQ
jgi:hypothetical protein